MLQNNLVIVDFILVIADSSIGRLAFISIICCKGKVILMFSTEIRAIVLYSGEIWRDGMERWRDGEMEKAYHSLHHSNPPALQDKFPLFNSYLI